MDKTIENENLQQEVARLTAENEALKAENKSLSDSKEFWISQANEHENRAKKLNESLKGLRSVIDAIVKQ